ncbi:helix-turn-helix domain-containing protein [Frankia sp. CNm7]|uniref:Helix-turn-helix domain-containing protein n=1 Tax=Frankia nepalensis TaxID=1836974 RepID=A0A937RME0_9ACTN|nr:helix-turn-helix domain-containing protein [Frankia nepalensis]MBL7499761.1 helix-turn-helix domain-containing protein [Frankia nepalensis]MBL7512246.1 helix-turn-helix domain-containing protein [Frankia nepalensis]MBL7524094.1 helix-turn-helix domain-containing protein [Frankia nepalensis]MBL7629048.1 helix-turn-helix domain-containing protein [Frankia nepalensis]
MPTQPARSVQRAAQVLKVLAATPDTDRSLSDIARAVGMPRSSCQAVLLALCDEGLALRRDPGPHYRLGPELLGLGRAASQAVALADVLADALPRLRDEFAATAMAGVVHGDSVVITAAYPVPHPYGLTVKSGSPLPLRAPIGPIYVAWAGGDAEAHWLARAQPALSPTQRDTHRAALAEVRARGWSATISSRRDQAAAYEPSTVHEATAADLASAQLRVIGLSAPVWASDRTLACSLALTALPGDLSGAELHDIATRVVDVAAQVTATIGGNPAHPNQPTSPPVS